MAEEVVDALLIESRFDDAGLEQSQRSALDKIARFTDAASALAREIAPISVNTDQIDPNLRDARGRIERFVAEARDVLRLPALDTDESVRELGELEAAFQDLAPALQQFDPSGVLRRVAVQVHGAVLEMQGDLDSLRAAEIDPRPIVESADELRGIITRLASDLPEFELGLNTAPADAAIARTEGEVAGFVARLRQASGEGAAFTLDALIGELARAQASLDATSRQAVALEAVIASLRTQQTALAGTTAGPALPTVPPPDDLIARRQAAVALSESLARAGRETRALAGQIAAAGAPQAQPFAPAINAADTLIQRMGLATRTVRDARESLSTPVQVPVTGARELAVLASGLVGLREETAEAEARLVRLRDTMLSEGQAARRAAGDNEAAAAAIGSIGVQASRVRNPADQAAAAGNKLRNALTGIAIGASGVPGPVGQAVNALSLLAFGGGLTAGIAVGAAAIFAGWELVTRGAREARQATDEYIDAQARAARARGVEGAGAEIARQFSGARGEVQGLTARLVELNRELERARQPTTVVDEAGNAFQFVDQGRIARIQAEIQDLADAAAETGRQFRDRVLAEIDAVARARLAAETQATQDELAIVQAGFRGREAALRASFDAEALTRQEYAAARISLAREAADAEIAALREQRAIVAREPARTEAEETARTARLAHIDALIRLRQIAVGQQVAEIRNEERLADLANVRAALAGTAAAQTLEYDVRVRPSFSTDEIDAYLDQVEADLRELFDRDVPVDFFSEIAEGALATVNALDQIAGAALNIDGIGERARAVIGDVVNLAGAIDAVIQAASAGNVAGLFAAGFSFLSGVLGGGPSEEDLARERNTAAIERNTEALRSQGVGDLDERRADIVRLARNQDAIAELESIQAPAISEPARRAATDEILAEFDLTMGELNALAERYGVEIFDSKGRLIAGSLDLLNESILTSVRAQLTAADTFAGQLEVLDLRSRINEGSEEARDPAAAFARTIAAAGRVGATAITQMFENIADEDAVRAALNQLLDQFEAGALDPSQLGGLTGEDIRQLLEDGATYLESFNEAVREATLAERQSLIDLRARLAGEGQDPIDVFGRQLRGLAEVFPEVAAQFQGIDPADQEAIREAALALFDSLAPDDPRREELLQFLAQTADYLGSFGDEVQNATDRLSDFNLPRGFRIDPFAFAAADLGPASGVVPFTGPVANARDAGTDQADAFLEAVRTDAPGTRMGRDFLDVLTAARGQATPLTLADLAGLLVGAGATATPVAGDGAALPVLRTAVGGTTVTVNIGTGAIVVQAQPGQDAGAIADQVLERFRRLAMSQTGDTLQGGFF